MILKRILCWWFGCKPVYEAEHHGSGVMPCERCGAADTTYEDRCGDTRHRRTVDWLVYWFWQRWQPERCYACGARAGHCKQDCDGIPF